MNPMETVTIRRRGRPRLFTPQMAAHLVRMYNEGQSMAALAYHFGTSKQTVANELHRHKANAPACDEQDRGGSAVETAEHGDCTTQVQP